MARGTDQALLAGPADGEGAEWTNTFLRQGDQVASRMDVDHRVPAGVFVAGERVTAAALNEEAQEFFGIAPLEKESEMAFASLSDHGYRRRDGQELMAGLVAKTLHRKAVLLAQAGVGVGKSLAYLVPAILDAMANEHGGAIIVSTKTIGLQDQLEHDLPRILEILGSNLPVLVSKGNGQYLCFKHAESFLREARIRQPLHPDPAGRLEAIRLLEDFVDEGRHELRSVERQMVRHPAISDQDLLNLQFTGPGECRQCAYLADCPVPVFFRSRSTFRRGILITNHGQLVEQWRRLRGNRQPLWPHPPRLLVIDEAHGLEGFLERAMRKSLSLQHLGSRVAEAGKMCIGKNKLWARQTGKAISYLVRYYQRHQEKEDEDGIRCSLEGLALGMLKEMGKQLPRGKGLIAELPESKSRNAILEEISEALKVLALAKENGNAVWLEENQLVVCPVLPADFLAEHLWIQGYPVVACSGTLAPTGDFARIVEEWGIAHGRREMLGSTAEPIYTVRIPSPYDYPAMMRYYLPNLPPPVRPKDAPADAMETYEASLAIEIRSLAQTAEGRALFLFTSKRQLARIVARLRQEGMSVIVETECGSLDAAVTRYLAAQQRGETAPLLSTSGWEGINLPGDALRLVGIVRLPFPVPDDPLHAGRMKRYARGRRKREQEYIRDIMLAKLHQGIGRLIRGETDRGVVAILDSRAERFGVPHGGAVPDAPVIRTLEEAQEFLATSFRDR